ncbi:Membrane protease YdiL, CAAX protease family [Ruminococcus sp. YRD2003]|uniref:CPBP family intramembrane glutamic endopeptidase n=1 Tax=Ruminococcus sp. YRD2003 TaxID=1452313 RepID=UPI0008C2B505|nr:Membrane protease YdiL, CAAX protease family [Ruminococcus flavefaciens]
MTTKNKCAKPLGIYLLTVFAFMLLFVLCIKPMNASNTVFYIIYMIFSFSPAIASLITRAVTKEGFRDMKLHLKLSGNFKWYLLAFGLPLICFSAKFLLPVILSGHADWLGGFTAQNVLSNLFTLAAMSAVMSIGILGEELGWRGYMNRKMEPLLGRVGTCIVGGIVWGLWHLPMDIFGCDGAISDAFAMCGGRMIQLTLFGVFLMWMTKKTDSVFPAVIGHYMFNESQGALANLLYQGNIPENADLGVIADVFEFLPMFVVAAVFMVMLLSDKNRTSKTV